MRNSVAQPLTRASFTSSDPGRAFLAWFARQNIPTIERRFQIGSLNYHYFSARFETVDRKGRSAHGSSADRKIAALKCTAECIERRLMVEFFKTSPHESTSLPPIGLRNSNGWAVHLSREKAEHAARKEALERHLLLKSFAKWRWAGFRHIQSVRLGHLTLHFMASRFETCEDVASLVVAQSNDFPGISLGYGLGPKSLLHLASFWEQPLYEAVGRILALDGKKIEPTSWLQTEAKYFLETPFELNCLDFGKNIAPELEVIEPGSTQVFDLSSRYNLDFPLYGAFHHGGSLIPLFHVPNFGRAETRYLDSIWKKNKFTIPPPERHPIL